MESDFRFDASRAILMSSFETLIGLSSHVSDNYKMPKQSAKSRASIIRMFS